MVRTNHNLRILTFVLLTILGLVLLVVGSLQGFSGVWTVLAALGAAILGAATPLLISTVIPDEFSELKDYLLRENSLASDPEQVEYGSGRWLLYHSSMRDGERRWVLDEYNLNADKSFGTLKCKTDIILENGTTKTYVVEAGIRANRMIFMIRPERGAEPHVIITIKGGVAANLETRCGVSIHQTWDDTPAFSRCLLRREPVEGSGVPIVPIGRSNFFSPADEAVLDALWVSEIAKQKIDVFV